MKIQKNTQVRFKTCSGCKVSQPLYEYTRNLNSFDGLNHRCKSCVKKRRKKSEIEILRRAVPYDGWIESLKKKK